MRSLCLWERKKERYSVSGTALRPDAAAIAFDDAVTDSNSQTGTRVFRFMQPSKEAEDLPGILLPEADAVILNPNR